MILEAHVYQSQFIFQRQHVRGRVANVGSNTDGAELRKMRPDNVNVDLFMVDPVTGRDLPTDIIEDARTLQFDHEFDTVVLGEILEHMEPWDAIQSLKSAKQALRPGGRVVVTIPHDTRREKGTEPPIELGKEFYAPGIHAYHYRCITRAELIGWMERADLNPVLAADISYCWGEKGSGIVAVVEGACQ